MIRSALVRSASLGLLVALAAACSSSEQQPPYPYDVPRPGEKGVLEAEILGARNGSVLEVRQVDGTVEFSVSLSDIMAPLRQQPWGPKAKEALEQLTQGKRALLRPSKHVLYEGKLSVLARVYVDGRDLSWEMVGSGNAWVLEPNSRDSQLKELQAWARARQKGLWSLPRSERVPPWEFGRARMEQRESP